MNVRNGWLQLTGAVLVTAAGSLSARGQDAADSAPHQGSNLRWKPHRIASAPASEAPSPPAAQPPSAETATAPTPQALASPAAGSTAARVPPASAA